MLASCNGMDISIFFPGKGQTTNAAMAICEECPVQTDCNEYASNHDTEHGVWGGRYYTSRK